MKRCSLAALALAIGAPAMAVTCNSTAVLTALGPPGTADFGQTFGAPAHYTDCYTFTLTGGANATGTTLEKNILFEKLLLDVTSVALFSGGLTSGQTTASPIATDTTPDAFDFTNLAAGTYTLVVESEVYIFLPTGAPTVSYTGTLTTEADGNPSPVPEPASLALALVGLVGAGVARRRRA